VRHKRKHYRQSFHIRPAISAISLTENQGSGETETGTARTIANWEHSDITRSNNTFYVSMKAQSTWKTTSPWISLAATNPKDILTPENGVDLRIPKVVASINAKLQSLTQTLKSSKAAAAFVKRIARRRFLQVCPTLRALNDPKLAIHGLFLGERSYLEALKHGQQKKTSVSISELETRQQTRNFASPNVNESSSSTQHSQREGTKE
jgi:hypothetical protein